MRCLLVEGYEVKILFWGELGEISNFKKIRTQVSPNPPVGRDSMIKKCCNLYLFNLLLLMDMRMLLMHMLLLLLLIMLLLLVVFAFYEAHTSTHVS